MLICEMFVVHSIMFQALLVCFISTVVLVEGQQIPSTEDETIQAYVLQKAHQLGYGLKILPKITDFFFGNSEKSYAENKPKTIPKKKSRLSRYLRPSRHTSHANNKEQRRLNKRENKGKTKTTRQEYQR